MGRVDIMLENFIYLRSIPKLMPFTPVLDPLFRIFVIPNFGSTLEHRDHFFNSDNLISGCFGLRDRQLDQPNPTFAKIPILDTGKFEQWKFKIQQYLQNEHYDLWEVIEFGDSYKAPPEETGKGSASESSTKKKGRTVVITTEDMQKRRNDVKARTTLLLALPDEHQLRFSKYETA
nr:hypothetical protein [Tanacetum cinerariifolium]